MTAGVVLTGSWSVLQSQWAKAPEICSAELMAAVTECDVLFEREVKDATPQGAQNSRQTIFSRETPLPGGALGEVGTPVMHLVYVELGTRPHFPPLQPLEDWAKAKLGLSDREAEQAAFAIARKIAARGTPAVRMFGSTFDRLKPQFERIFEKARDRVAARLAGQ